MAGLALEAGKLRHVVTVDVVEESDQDDGTVLQTVTSSISRHAAIEPLKGQEYWDAQQCKAQVTHRVTMRYCEELSRKCRITFGLRTFNVVSVLNTDERNHVSVALCQEVV